MSVCTKHPELLGERYATGACKGCGRLAANAWRRRNLDRAKEGSAKQRAISPEKGRALANARYLANPGLWRIRQLRLRGFTPETFARAKEAQGNACAICGCDLIKLPSKHVHADHDHATNTPRGVLCNHCNHGLGNFADRPETLIQAAWYLMNPTLKGKV